MAAKIKGRALAGFRKGSANPRAKSSENYIYIAEILKQEVKEFSQREGIIDIGGIITVGGR